MHRWCCEETEIALLTWLAYPLIAFALVLGAWCVVAALRGARPSTAQLVAAAVLEGALVLQGLIGIVMMLSRSAPLDRITFVGYHLTAIVVLIAGVLWGIADRSRWGNGVFAIASFTEAVLVLRLLQIWSSGG